MKKDNLQEIAQAAAKNIKTEADLNEFKQMLTKITLEAALNAGLGDHLGYSKHEKANTNNSCNGYSTKILQTEDGQFELDTPRDRNGDFEPKLIKRNQRRFVSMNDKVFFLYAQGLSTREVATTLKEMYDTDILASLVSRITNAVIDEVIEWQARPLDSV